jgi:hypothetical protein
MTSREGGRTGRNGDEQHAGRVGGKDDDQQGGRKNRREGL